MELKTPNRQDSFNLEVTTIAKGAGIVYIGTFLGIGLKYVFELLIARKLGPSLFGIFFLGFSIFKILERISTVGLHNGVLRYVSIFRSVGDKARLKGTILLSLKIVTAFGLLIFIIISVLSSKISTHIFDKPELATILPLFAAVVIFSVVTEIFIYSTLAFQTTKYKTLVRMIFEPGIRILLVISAFLLGWDLLGAVYAFGISLIAGMGLAFLSLSKLFPAFNQRSVKPVYETIDILRFSWPLFFVGFFNIALVQINTLILGYFKEAPEVGIYGAAFRTAFLIPISLESINAIFAPIISELYIKKDIQKLENLFKITTKWIFTISFPLFLYLVFYAEPILQIWGKDYVTGAVCLVILCVGQLINSAVGSVGYMITMIGRSKINLANISGILFLNVILNLILIPKYGIIGAAISVTASLVLINIVRLVEVFVILKIHPYRWDFLKPLVAGVVTILFVFFTKMLDLNFENSLLSLVLVFFMFVVLYSGSLFLLGIEKEDKFILDKVKKSISRKKTL
jgi:O-antigen/teichoic acid export membrane protein